MHRLMWLSIRRRPKVHLTLFVLLVCAFVLPFIFCMLKDSVVEGRKQQEYADTRNATFIVHGAKEQDTTLFRKITELTYEYIDGNIYLYSSLSRSETDDENNAIALSQLAERVRQIIKNTQPSTLYLRDLSRYSTRYIDEQTRMFSAQLDRVILIVIILSVCIVLIAYRIHLQSFELELRVYRSLGATQAQIFTAFLFELSVLSALAAITGFCIAGISMYMLMNGLLSVRSGDIAWIVFHIDGWGILNALTIILVALLLVFIFSMRHLNRPPKVHTTSPFLRTPTKHSCSLTLLLLKRNGWKLIMAAIVSIPLLILCNFLFNYAAINIREVKTAPEYDILLSKQPVNIQTQSLRFSDEDMDFLRSIAGNENIRFETDTDYTAYLILLETNVSNHQHEHSNDLFTMDLFGKRYFQTHIQPQSKSSYQDLPLRSGQIIVNKNHPKNRWRVGDTLTLYRREDLIGFLMDKQGKSINTESKPMLFEVVGQDNHPYLDGPLRLYVSSEDYPNFTNENEGYRFAFITANDATEHARLLRQIRQRYSDQPEYGILDAKLQYEQTSRLGDGIYVLMLYIVLFSFLLIYIAVRTIVADHIRKQTTVMDILYHQGATKQMVRNCYVRHGLIFGGFSLLIASMFGYVFSLLFFRNTGYTVTANPLIALMKLSGLLLYISAYYLPIVRTIHKHLAERR